MERIILSDTQRAEVQALLEDVLRDAAAAAIAAGVSPREIEDDFAARRRRMQELAHRVPGMDEPPSITCPKCSWTSYHPKDIEQGYCGNCHEFTSAPPLSWPLAAEPQPGQE